MLVFLIHDHFVRLPSVIRVTDVYFLIEF